MREFRSSGSVRGALRKERPYREGRQTRKYSYGEGRLVRECSCEGH